MKKLIFMLTLLVSSTGFAIEFDSEYTKMIFEHRPVNKCLKSSDVGLQIVSTIDEHTYMMIVPGDEFGVYSHAVLETSKTVFSSPGRFILQVRYDGAVDIPLDNGFKVKHGVWRECTK